MVNDGLVGDLSLSLIPFQRAHDHASEISPAFLQDSCGVKIPGFPRLPPLMILFSPFFPRGGSLKLVRLSFFFRRLHFWLYADTFAPVIFDPQERLSFFRSLSRSSLSPFPERADWSHPLLVSHVCDFGNIFARQFPPL